MVVVCFKTKYWGVIIFNAMNFIYNANNLKLRDVVENSTEIGLQNIMKRYLLVGNRKVEVKK